MEQAVGIEVFGHFSLGLDRGQRHENLCSIADTGKPVAQRRRQHFTPSTRLSVQQNITRSAPSIDLVGRSETRPAPWTTRPGMASG